MTPHPLRPVLLAVMAAMIPPAAAHAGEAVLYQPAPRWVVPPAANPAAALVDDRIVLSDMQLRFVHDLRWGYFATSTRIASAEMLAQNANVTLPWVPDKGDLVIHDLAILRGGQRIDLLAQGLKFTVLRREENLEQREMTGTLTATLAIPGLQVGDIIRLAASITARDPALAGRVQWAAPLIALPLPVAPSTMRLSWPSAEPMQWKLLAEGVTAITAQQGNVSEVSLAIPVPKQPDIPADAPARLRHQPLIEVSSFAGWTDVSRTMAPLYATDGAIPPGSPLAVEVAQIMAAHSDPLARAADALQRVQDKVRYLALQMSGGNYVPQSPARTWELRYGDCKAKTLLLLAMLRSMGITAEPVLANQGLDDLLPDRLASAQAFNHIFVRATIGGQSIWLDGTRSGDRLADIRDTPVFAHVLPVRSAGAGLETIARTAPARPGVELNVIADESAAGDLDVPLEVRVILHGALASRIAGAAAEMTARQKRQFTAGFIPSLIGPAVLSRATIDTDPANGTVRVTARATIDSPWARDGLQQRQAVSHLPRLLTFDPDRSRAAWAAIPVATGDPDLFAYHLLIKLPDGGRGITVTGEQESDALVAGAHITRHLALSDGLLRLDETMAISGAEVAASAIPATRDRIATANARAPQLMAPADLREHWDLTGADPAGASQIAALNTAYAAAIAEAERDDTVALGKRATLRERIGDRRGALADIATMLAQGPTIDVYLARAQIEQRLGDLAAASADATAARRLDPSNRAAVELVAILAAKRGDVGGGTALLDERIALGGETRPAYAAARARLVGEYGDAQQGIADLDALIAAKPGSPGLLNARCWVKALRSVMLDSAVKDCTSAIELSDSPAGVLDSRAVVWLRLGRYDDALRDIDAALAQAPGLGPSHLVRAIILTRLGRGAEAAHDLALAHRIAPEVEAEYARFGLKP